MVNGIITTAFLIALMTYSQSSLAAHNLGQITGDLCSQKSKLDDTQINLLRTGANSASVGELKDITSRFSSTCRTNATAILANAAESKASASANESKQQESLPAAPQSPIKSNQ